MKIALRLLGLLRPHRRAIVSVWGISVFLLCLQLFAVWVGAGFIERLLSPQGGPEPGADYGSLATGLTDMARSILQRSTPFRSLLAGVIFLLGTQLLISASRVVKHILLTRTNQEILCRVRADMFRHLARLDLSFSRRVPPGETASLFNRDVEQLNFALLDLAERALVQPLRLLVLLAVMASVSPAVTGVAVLFLLVCGLAVHRVGGAVERHGRRSLERSAELQGHLTEYLSTVVLARSLAREDAEASRFEETSRRLRDSQVRMHVAVALSSPAVRAIFAVAGAAVLVFCGYRTLVLGSLPASALLRLALLLPLLAGSMEAVGTIYTGLRASLASARRIFAFLDEPADAADSPSAVDPAPLTKGIRLERVTFEASSHLVLKDVSLEIPRGRTVLVHGPSGAGKTTILGIVAGFLRPTGGKVLVDGVDLRTIRGAAWRRRIGIVPQDAVLLNTTVRENLRYADPDAGDAALLESLDAVLLTRDGAGWREGLDTVVGNRGEMVSGGERQRLTIARALLLDPELLLLDEPTSMLDAESRAAVLSTVRAVAARRTVVIVTHDPDLLELADIRLAIDRGRITAPPAPGSRSAR